MSVLGKIWTERLPIEVDQQHFVSLFVQNFRPPGWQQYYYCLMDGGKEFVQRHCAIRKTADRQFINGH